MVDDYLISFWRVFPLPQLLTIAPYCLTNGIKDGVISWPSFIDGNPYFPGKVPGRINLLQ